MKGKSDYPHGPSSFSVLTLLSNDFSSFSKFSQLFINMQMTYFSYRVLDKRTCQIESLIIYRTCNNDGLGLKSVNLLVILRFLPHVLRFYSHHEYVD